VAGTKRHQKLISPSYIINNLLLVAPLLVSLLISLVVAGFGELALLYDCPRAATCIVTSPKVDVWRVDRKTFQICLRKFREESTSKAVDVLRQVEGFGKLDEDLLHRIGEAMTEVTFSRGQAIVKKNEAGKAFYIIMEGKVNVSNIGSGRSTFSEHTLGAWDYFGERSLITNEKRAADIIVASDICRVMALDKESFDKYLGDFMDLLSYCENKRLLKSIPVIAKSTLESFQIDKIMGKVRLHEERSDELITPPQAAKTARTRTSVQDEPPL